MAAKLTRLDQKIAILVHLVAEDFSSCSSRYWWRDREILGTSSYALKQNLGRNLRSSGVLRGVIPQKTADFNIAAEA